MASAKTFVVCVLFVLAAATCRVFATSFEDCGSDYGEVKSVVVSNCPDHHEYCELVRGTRVSMKVEFVPHVPFKDLELMMFIVASEDLELNIDVPEPYICNKSVACPGEKLKNATYYGEWDIDEGFMAAVADVRFAFVNENDETLVCIEIPFEIVDEEDSYCDAENDIECG